MKRSEDLDGAKRVLEDAFGDRPATWIDIRSDVFPECTEEAVRTYLHGPRGSLDQRTSDLISACLKWRPQLRWAYDFPRSDDQSRIPCLRFILRDDHDRIVAIECRGTAGEHRVLARFERLEDDESRFAVRLEGVGDGSQAGVLIGHRLLPTFEPEAPGEWARVPEAWLGGLLADESPMIEVVTPRRRVHPGGRRQAIHRFSKRIPVVLAGNVMTAVAAMLLISVFWIGQIDRASLEAKTEMADVANLSFEKSDDPSQQTLFTVESRHQYVRTSDGGVTLASLSAGEPKSPGSVTLDGRKMPLGSIQAPPELSVWYTHEPYPVTARMEVADVLPEHPGEEIIFLRRHRMIAVAVIEIRDANANVLRRVYSRGYLTDMVVTRDGKIAVIHAGNSLPQTIPVLQGWESIALAAEGGHVYPNVLVVIDPKALPARSGLFPIRASASLPRTPVEHFLAQPPTRGHDGVYLRRVRLARERGSIVTLEFVDRRFGGNEVVTASVDAAGRLDHWLDANGNSITSPAGDLVRINTDAWGEAVDTVEKLAGPSPQATLEVVQRDAAAGRASARAVHVAELRAQSAIWRMSLGYEAVSYSEVTEAVAQLVLDDVSALAPSADRPWAPRFGYRQAAVVALAQARLGREQEAFETLAQVRGEVSEEEVSTKFELMAVAALTFAGFGHFAEARATLSNFDAELAQLPEHRQWLVGCDERTERVLDQARMILENQPADVDGVSWLDDQPNMHRPMI